MDQERTCKTCGVVKALSEFPLGKNYRGGRKPNCNPCSRALHKAYRVANMDKVRGMWRKATKRYYRYERFRDKKFKAYGITAEEFQAMHIAQDGKCKICKQAGPLDIDHCHKTGSVRGLLCGLCNRGLGCFRDDVARLTAALEYIQGTPP